MISGFETGGSSYAEYTAAVGLTVVDGGSYKFISPKHATINLNGYVYWTVSEGEGGGSVCLSVNMYITSTSYIDISMTRGGDTYKARISPSGGGDYYKDARLYGPSGYDSGIHPIEVFPGQWVNIVMTVGYKNFRVYVEGSDAQHCRTAWASSVGTITQIRIDAPSVDIRIDDVCTWAGYYTGAIAIVQPFTPWLDRHKELTGSSEDYNNWDNVCDTPPGDSTYVSITNDSGKYDFYGCRLNTGPAGWTLMQILSMRTFLRCSSSHDTGDEVCAVGIKVGDDDTPIWSSNKDLSTSWGSWHDYWVDGGDAGYLRSSWFEKLDAHSMQIGVKLTAGSGETAYCSTLIAQVLCLYKRVAVSSSAIVLTGGFDITFDLDTSGWSDGDSVTLDVNTAGTPIGAANIADPQTAIHIYYTTLALYAGVRVRVCTYPTRLLCTEDVLIRATLGAMHLRIIMHENFITVLNSDQYVYTFSMRDVNYASTLELWARTNRTSQSITNVVVSELADWREGIYIDMETSIMSGISSIIQERPIEILPLEGGIVDFSYNRARDEITPGNIVKHDINEANVPSAGSHYIIYYSDVAMLVDETFMDDNGYLSRVLQMSQLATGAANAAKIVAQRAREYQEQHQVQISPDIRIEPGDKAIIGYTISGTGTVVSKSIIVETVQLHIAEGDYTMLIGGRKYV